MDKENEVKEIISKHLNLSEVKSTDNLVYDLGADSLDTVEILMRLEDRYNIRMPDIDQTKVTVQDLINEVMTRKNEAE